MARHFATVTTMLVTAQVACGGESGAGSAGAIEVLRETTGTLEVVTVRGPIRPLSIQHVVELGTDDPSLDGSGPQDFAWISSVAVTPSGKLFAADLGRFRIEVFEASTGEHVRTIGSRGDGPVEFESVFSVAPYGDDILTMDIGNGRTTRLSTSGEWLAQWTAAGRLVASPVDFRLYPVGPSEVYQWAYSSEEGLDVPVWRRYSAMGVDEMPRVFPVVEQSFPDRVMCQMGRGFSWFPHPEAAVALAHPLPGRRSVIARTDLGSFAILNQSGDTLRVVRREAEEVAMTDQRWSAIAERFDAWLEDKDASQCEPRELTRPDFLPALRSVVVDVAGRIWVERTTWEGTVWEGYDDSGEPVGALPGLGHDRERTVPFFGDRFVAWVTRGEFDIPLVRVAAWGD